MCSPQDSITEIGPGLGLRLEVHSGACLDELTAAVNAVCASAEDQPQPTAVVLQLGAGEPGEQAWPGAVTIQQVNRWERAVVWMERLAAVSIAVADRPCGGPALDLLLATDYRIVTTDFSLSLPINDGQFWPGMAIYRLATQIGVARARQLVLWGNTVTAAQAAEIGLVDEITSDPAAATQAAVVMLARIAGPDLAIRRQLLTEAPAVSYEEALGPHLAACDRELRRIRGRVT